MHHARLLDDAPRTRPVNPAATIPIVNPTLAKVVGAARRMDQAAHGAILTEVVLLVHLSTN